MLLQEDDVVYKRGREERDKSKFSAGLGWDLAWIRVEESLSGR